MEPLTWTGNLSFLNLPLQTAAALFFILAVVQILVGFVPSRSSTVYHDSTLAGGPGLHGWSARLTLWSFYLVLALCLAYLVLGMMMGTSGGILGGAVSRQFTPPVWIALVITFVLSLRFKRRLGGLYGKLFDSTIGMVGFGLVMFWVFTAIFAGLFDMIYTHGPLEQVSGMKNKLPGTPMNGAEGGADYPPWYLFGGDNLARDVFSRMVVGGSVTVILIAPLATVFAFMVGITLGLPAGYYGGGVWTRS